MPYPISTPGQDSASGNSKRWPAFPGIPIFLETHDERRTPKTYGTTPTTPTTPEILTHPRPAPSGPARLSAPEVSPVATSPTTTIQTSSNRSSVWPIPEPPPEVQHQEARRPTLNFFPTERPRIRLNGMPTLQIPTFNEKTPINPKDPGLGITDGFPKPPSIEVFSPVGEKDVPSQNIAERIEKRLYQYSISGSILKRWLLELVSWIFSAVCMAATIGVLIYLRDKPLADWPLADSTGLTLNAYISVLSKMAGAALILPVSEALGQLKWSWFQQNSKQMWDFEIFDNASRGPWGSLLLLLRTKGKALAALGAMITLCMMALDPFFQQVVSFPDRWTLQETSSRIPRSVRYEPTLPKVYQEGALLAFDDPIMALLVQEYAFGNGTESVSFGNGTRPDIPLSCPTSNCTWPVYDTLAVCSQCADVSNELTYTCFTDKIDWISNTTGGFEVQGSWPNATMCGYFLNATSEHPVMMSGYLVNENNNTAGETLIMRALPLTDMYTRETMYGNGSIHFKHLRNALANVLIVSAVDGLAANVHQNVPPIAQECVLSWCVQTMRSSYNQGEYEEEIIDTFFNTTSGPSPWNVTIFQTESGNNGTDTYYMEDINIDLGMTRSGRNITGYGASRTVASRLVNGFMDIFPSFTTVQEDTEEPMLRYKVWSDGPAYLRELEFNPWLAPNNVSRHMERLATSMTNIMRSDSSRVMLAGEAYSRESYVSVTWEWLTLPLGLLCLSFVFLAATIFKSAFEKDQVGVLKNSAILTLLYGLPDDMRGKLTRSSSTGTPRAKAKEMKVKLNANMGWRLSGNIFSPLPTRQLRPQPPPGWI